MAISSSANLIITGMNNSPFRLAYTALGSTSYNNWTILGSPTVVWTKICASSDGSTILGVGTGDYPYLSTAGAGGTFNTQTTPGQRNWTCASMSDDGYRMVVAGAAPQILCIILQIQAAHGHHKVQHLNHGTVWHVLLMVLKFMQEHRAVIIYFYLSMVEQLGHKVDLQLDRGRPFVVLQMEQEYMQYKRAP